MSIEGGPNFGSMYENESVFYETVRNPELVFCEDLEQAKNEHLQIQQRLDTLPEGRIRVEASEFSIEKGMKSPHRNMIIRWNKSQKFATQLNLHPISGGRGPESNLIGYTGTYDLVDVEDHHNVKIINSIRLENLFKAPSGVRFAIKPTQTRWAIGKDEMVEVLGSEDYWTLYMGLGFLFLGEQWMLIGFHEAGHIPKDHTDINPKMRGENQAWSAGLKNYAQMHWGNPETSGLFDLLKKPEYRHGARVNLHSQPTIGEIVKYGLVSHFMDPEVRIPQQWKGPSMEKAGENYNSFTEIVRRAERTKYNLR